jgi:hypothetical protein
MGLTAIKDQAYIEPDGFVILTGVTGNGKIFGSYTHMAN